MRDKTTQREMTNLFRIIINIKHMSERHKRQSDIIKSEDLSRPIHVIGCGGIGSWSALLLAKMGCQDITIYDFDNVEEHNVASQFYKQFQVGIKKTTALKQNVHEQTGVELKIGNVEEEHLIRDNIVIIAVDKMSEREKFAIDFRYSDNIIIDGRMGGLQAEIYCCSSLTYGDTIVDEDEVQQERCTEKSISFNCALIGSLIANAVRVAVKDADKLFSEYRERTFLFEGVSVLNPAFVRREPEEVTVPTNDDNTITT